MTSRRIRYQVAMSLDGFIAGPNGDIDWIIPDPDVDFAAVYSAFDAALLGRRTYELTQQPGAPPWPPGWDIHVVSSTLQPSSHSSVHVIGTDIEAAVNRLKAVPGRDIWLFGGGALASSLLSMNLVDTIEVAIMPVVLGGGTPFVQPRALRTKLALVHTRQSRNGTVSLRYDVRPSA